MFERSFVVLQVPFDLAQFCERLRQVASIFRGAAELDGFDENALRVSLPVLSARLRGVVQKLV